MTARTSPPESPPSPLPNLRFEIVEAAQILRMSRAQLYNRIQEGSIRVQKDGMRTYITHAELERYVDSCTTRIPAAR
jgi:Helix-turn-helix domain